MKQSVENLEKHCLVCGKNWGPAFRQCCTPNSVVARQYSGLFRKRPVYFSLGGEELQETELSRLRDQESLIAQEQERKQLVQSELQGSQRSLGADGVKCPRRGAISQPDSESCDCEGSFVPNPGSRHDHSGVPVSRAGPEKILVVVFGIGALFLMHVATDLRGFIPSVIFAFVGANCGAIFGILIGKMAKSE